VYPGKTAVMGLLDREQRTIHATIVPNVKRDILQAVTLNEVEHGAKVYTDQAASYDILAKHYTHEIVNDMETYVKRSR
jgi:ISXO2-like transposase domain